MLPLSQTYGAAPAPCPWECLDPPDSWICLCPDPQGCLHPKSTGLPAPGPTALPALRPVYLPVSQNHWSPYRWVLMGLPAPRTLGSPQNPDLGGCLLASLTLARAEPCRAVGGAVGAARPWLSAPIDEVWADGGERRPAGSAPDSPALGSVARPAPLPPGREGLDAEGMPLLPLPASRTGRWAVGTASGGVGYDGKWPILTQIPPTLGGRCGVGMEASSVISFWAEKKIAASALNIGGLHGFELIHLFCRGKKKKKRKKVKPQSQTVAFHTDAQCSKCQIHMKCSHMSKGQVGFHGQASAGRTEPNAGGWFDLGLDCWSKTTKY